MIKVYSKPNCMQCNFTKNYLDDHQIEFQEIDVSQDENAMDQVIELGFSAFPVVVADGLEPWYGFRPDLLNYIIDHYERN